MMFSPQLLCTPISSPLAEEMLDITDDGSNDWMEIHDKDGTSIGWKLNGEHVQRSRLRVDTRKWVASRLKPKKYSERLDMNHGVQPDAPLARSSAACRDRALSQRHGALPTIPRMTRRRKSVPFAKSLQVGALVESPSSLWVTPYVL
jgi:hypothetical protein